MNDTIYSISVYLGNYKITYFLWFIESEKKETSKSKCLTLN